MATAAIRSDGNGGYLSTLRTYTVSGTGAAATIAWSADYQMADPDNWATDEHGIAMVFTGERHFRH